MKAFLFIVTFLSVQLCIAQVDYDEISHKTSDVNNSFYYQNLLERFNASDSTLTKEDFHALYYGAIFLPSYLVTEINKMEALIREANYNKEFLRAYELADSLIAIYPMSIQAYFEKAFACYNLKRFDEETFNKKRYKILIITIMNSGDGKTLTTAWHANLPNDEFEVIRYLGADIKEETEFEKEGKLFDLFDLKSNKAKIKKVIFNVTKQGRL